MMLPVGLDRLAQRRHHAQLFRALASSATGLDVPAARMTATASGFFPIRHLLGTRAPVDLVAHAGNGDVGDHDGTHLSITAYEATHTFLIIVLMVFGMCLMYTLPYTIIRIRHSPKWCTGFILGKSSRREIEEKQRLTILAPVHRRALANVPPRLPHYISPIPTYRIPYIGLSISQAIAVGALWITASVGAWVDANFVWEASRSAYVVLVLLLMLVTLAAKAGGIGTILGCGYASINFLHRWTGRLVFFIITLHVVAYLVLFLQRGTFMHEMTLKPNVLAIMAYAGLCTVGIVSVGPIRRRWWIVFKVGHHIGIILMLGGLNYHSRPSMPYIIVLLVFLGLNATLRIVTTRFHRATLIVLPGADTTLVSLPLTTGYYPGQHLRIRVWTSNKKMGFAGWLEAHPFSIASAPGPEDNVRLLVKKAGDWTNGLYDLAASGQVLRRGGKEETMERRVLVTVEGPYGGPLNMLFPSFEAVMVCAGGSGVSFALSVAQGVVRGIKRGTAACRNLVFVWTVRDRGNLEALFPLLQALIDEASTLDYICPDFTLTLELYFTKPAKRTSVSKPFEQGAALDTCSPCITVSIENRRPDVNALLHRLALDISPRGGGVGIGACGPRMLVDGLENAVRLMASSDTGKRAGGIVMHSESFSL